ncbi:hypothetical protein Tsubulata_021622 [Turnera subulata]|uniref:C2 domain-containing protein n=1 Tax=Turnera subulata TaxID=218843 RepID=A0A9Q0FVS2_9ROSI|nr:hypothetical protein Tsubulata_021622 [Turnera subulata]
MPPKEDFSFKKIRPNINREAAPGHKLALVEHMQYLYIKLWSVSYNLLADVSYIQVKIGNYQARTGPFDMSAVWKGQVFAFNKEHLHSKTVEIVVKDMMDLSIGQFSIAIGDVPTLNTGDPKLVPTRYSLEDENGVVNGKGEVMFSAWMGNQGDEAFPEAWNSDAASVSVDHMHYTRAHMYTKPRLWYLRVKVMEAQDLVPVDKKLEFFVTATLGGVKLRTQVSASKMRNPKWSEELIFVAAEPSQEKLILTVEQPLTVEEKDTAVALPKNQEPTVVLGFLEMPLKKIDKVLLPPPASEKWVNLERHVKAGEEKNMQTKFASKVRMIVYLDGLYHVFDEPAHLSSDLTSSSPKLKPGAIGVLEVGILKAEGLAPMKKRNGIEITDAFCVAKYGGRWHKTRTIADNLAPKWNEQYQWEVCEVSTVLTIGVFDNRELAAEGEPDNDGVIGKVRISPSMLETDRIYAYAHPLVRVGRKGVKKMGELHLVIRFSCPDMYKLLMHYTGNLLSKPSYASPMSVYQINSLRPQAVWLLCSWFARSDPPLSDVIVRQMLDAKTPGWSVRRAKANFARVCEGLSWFIALWTWLDDIRQWNNPGKSIVTLVLFGMLTFWPLPILVYPFLFLGVKGLWNYRKRSENPPSLDAKLSLIEEVTADDFDEELDTFPSSAPYEVIRARYDRLRSIGQMISASLGDLANQLERFHSLLSWRDPRATLWVVLFCFLAVILCYLIPSRLFFFLAGCFLMRGPRFRITLPPVPQSIFRRLAGKEISMIYN